MQLTTYEGLVQRIVFYGCELYAGQLMSGDKYETLNPVYSIWLVNGILWPDATRVHHAFRLADTETGRVLGETLEIHTLELGRYNVTEADLTGGDVLACWLYWLLHAHEYERAALLELLPQQAIRQATETLARISQISEDKAMYDAREKAIRDRNWELNATFRQGKLEGKLEGKIEGKLEGKLEGKIEGEIKGKLEGKIEMIRTLQSLLGVSETNEQVLRVMNMEQLEAMTSDLQVKLRSR